MLVSAVDLANVFETFLPLLLLYPNPSDPFNVDAAVQMLRDKEQYEKRVKGIILCILDSVFASFCLFLFLRRRGVSVFDCLAWFLSFGWGRIL